MAALWAVTGRVVVAVTRLSRAATFWLCNPRASDLASLGLFLPWEMGIIALLHNAVRNMDVTCAKNSEACWLGVSALKAILAIMKYSRPFGL